MRLQNSTVLISSLGAVTALAVIALTGRRRASLMSIDEAYPLPPRVPPPASSTSWQLPAIDPPVPDSIPEHTVTVQPSATTPAASTAAPKPRPALPPPALPMAPQVETMVRELSRPNMTPAKPPLPPPSGVPDDEAERMVRELTRPDSTAASRSPRQAATDLYTYVTQAMRQGLDAPLGSKSKPDDYLAACQRDMRLIASDGIYGPKTAARGKELIGREFPPRNATKRRVSLNASVINSLPAATASVLSLPPPEPPPLQSSVAETSPREAAAALFELVTHPPVSWGSKAAPNPLIRGAQRDMGGLVADGVYGPKTQARGAILLGRSFPARK
jgi:peptidoglycan hydrolase-like protein with peptidoglycan-binding domain